MIKPIFTMGNDSITDFPVEKEESNKKKKSGKVKFSVE
jgi:hypothetical protein